MGITRSLLPQKYGNLPLPSYWGNLYGNFAHFYYQKITQIYMPLLEIGRAIVASRSIFSGGHPALGFKHSSVSFIVWL